MANDPSGTLRDDPDCEKKTREGETVMKFRRLMVTTVLMAMSAGAFAQSDAQKTFDKLKTLSGSWEGTVTATPPQPEVQGKNIHVSLRTTSTGHALMHEMTVNGREDNPVTMLYLDGDRLMLTHYCDAGNRPRMVAKASPDGKTVEFDFLDVDGGTQYGHMHHAVFTMVDANHHTEEWTYMGPGDNPIHAHFDLQRGK
jgi:hypothetical protein